MLSVGEILRKERERRGFTLRHVEKETKVREKFLKAIEDNQWDIFSSKIYICGVIKNYADFLGLDHDKMLAFFRRDYEKRDELGFRKNVASSYLRPETKSIIYIGLLVVFLVFFGYFGYQLKLFLSPPTVTIISPTQSKFRAVEDVRVVGTADKESTVTIFGDHIYQNKDGTFEYLFPLKKGHNVLPIEVVGANGRKAELKKDFILE